MSEQEKSNDGNLLTLPNFYDYLKQMTTLSTGSVVLLATFAEKFPKDAKWRALLSVSVCSFLLAVLGCVVSMFFVLSCQRHKTDLPEWEVNIAVAFFILGAAALFGGLLSIGAFAMKNF